MDDDEFYEGNFRDNDFQIFWFAKKLQFLEDKISFDVL